MSNKLVKQTGYMTTDHNNFGTLREAQQHQTGLDLCTAIMDKGDDITSVDDLVKVLRQHPAEVLEFAKAINKKERKVAEKPTTTATEKKETKKK